MYEKYFNKLREECLIRNRSSRTADTYINNIRHFMKWTGYKPMEDLSLQDARSFILEKRNSGLSSATCNFYNSSICFLYKHVLHIPWDQDIVPRMRLDVKLPKVLSLEEIEKLINSATQIRNKAIIALLYSSGMRVGELVSLKPEDIYMSTMQVYISKGKNHRDRWTILSERALDLLKEYWRSYPVKREYLFVSLDAPHELLKVSGVEIMLRAVGKTAGIEAHPHTLRHSFANAELATIMLEDAGMTVTRASDGKEVVNLFKNHPRDTYDLILMDIMMPNMDGHQATKAIRALGIERLDAVRIPIIALSANAFIDDIQESLDSGMNDHISKPINMEELIDTITKYIKHD